MLNSLPNNQTTVKTNLLKGINAIFKDVLADKVLHDKVGISVFRLNPLTRK